MNSGLFAVIDTETTGLFPGKHDRVAEIAIVTMDRSGRIVDRWESLINPERDLGKQSIHGIRARDVLAAPTFRDLADEIEWRLSGTVVVAHNLSFDGRFLDAEFQRAGRQLPGHYLPNGLCTMRMVHRYLPGGGRSLQDCCDAFSIELTNAHCAGDDAEAAAVLLSRYIDLDDSDPIWDVMLARATDSHWRSDPPVERYVPVVRGSGAPAEPEHFLNRIVVRLPEFTGPAEHENYLAVLDMALLDRHLSAHEEAMLVETAHELGIGRDGAASLHRQYFEQVVEAAWADGTLTEQELIDIAEVAALLGIDEETLRAAQIPRTPEPSTGNTTNPDASRLPPGTLIVLTGDMSRPRSEIEDILRAAGFVPRRAVTKKVGLVVAADPDSLSGKARKARDYGIPVVGESFLWHQLGLGDNA
ncbi:exonuclease domain-containing protein [Zafaria sp. J156]|uniref:exonuclease domain-containing protein n=1 Tax=Zafaria sp. J156 TaxID=3116490 RepID=UPI002E76EA02|nr:exonuclease domain-containing protein [Zafaria sp. J156]MEE1621637.1 exonuclease domain-containing protein [Zafaria sp. J156]